MRAKRIDTCQSKDILSLKRTVQTTRNNHSALSDDQILLLCVIKILCFGTPTEFALLQSPSPLQRVTRRPPSNINRIHQDLIPQMVSKQFVIFCVDSMPSPQSRVERIHLSKH